MNFRLSPVLTILLSNNFLINHKMQNPMYDFRYGTKLSFSVFLRIMFPTSFR